MTETMTDQQGEDIPMPVSMQSRIKAMAVNDPPLKFPGKTRNAVSSAASKVGAACKPPRTYKVYQMADAPYVWRIA